MPEPEDEPAPFYQRNDAPELPHFGKHFEYHGPSGVLTFRIDTQCYTHDGLVMLSGMCIHGEEVFETGYRKSGRGELLSVWVTESQYMRLSNGPLE